MILTIAVPLYNMEELIKRCLDSVLVPEYQGVYEVLVINDGSKDRSLTIAKDFEIKYPEVFRVIDKNNGNWGSCINLAISEARGKYLRVLDADDYFGVEETSAFIEQLLALKDDVDLVQTRCQLCYSDGSLGESFQYKIEYGKVYSADKIVFSWPFMHYAIHTATFNVELLRTNGIKLQEGMSYCDVELCTYSYAFVNKVVFFDIILYKYNIGRPGQSVSHESYLKAVDKLERIFSRMIDERQHFFAAKGTNKLKSQSYYVSALFGQYTYIMLLENKKIADSEVHKKRFAEIWKDMLNYFPDIYENIKNNKIYGLNYVKIWNDKGLFISDIYNGLYLEFYKYLHGLYMFLKKRILVK